jgi:hypothetical protein
VYSYAKGFPSNVRPLEGDQGFPLNIEFASFFMNIQISKKSVEKKRTHRLH